MIREILQFQVRCCLWLLVLLFPAAHRLEATRTRSDALGLQGRYWMMERQLPYLFENPAVLFSFRNTAYAETDGNTAEGGFIFAGESVGVGIFSGRPTSDAQLNSALPPGGMYHTGGSKFFPLVDTGAGLALDAAATNTTAGFGNLNSRVSRLNDPGDNRLRQKNLGFIFATGNRKNAFAVLAEYGVARDAENYEGASRESLSLSKSQTTVGIGFLASPGKLWKLFDGSLQFSYFNINNSYRGQGLSGELLNANYGTSGAYELYAGLRTGFRLSSEILLYPRLSLGVFDYSSQATAKAQGGVLTPGFDVQDTYSRTGYRYNAGIALRRVLPAGAFLLAGLDAEYMFLESFYDSRDYGNSLYASFPLAAKAEYLRVPLIVALEAEVSADWQLRFAIQHPLYALPEVGFALRETEQYRANNSFPDITYGETSGRRLESGSTTITTGFSYRISDFRIDWLTSVSLLRRGPNLLSGVQEALASRLGITYNFDSLIKGENNEKN